MKRRVSALFSSDMCPFHSFRWPMLAAAGETSFGILVPNEGLSEDRRELMRSRAVAQPFGTYTQLLRLRNAGEYYRRC
jgi:hypothetical protein